MHSDAKITGRNIKATRKALGLSLLDFSLLAGISKASLVNIEGGLRKYSSDLLKKVSDFTLYPTSKLFSEDFKPDLNLREKLIKRYKNNIEYSQILNKPPEISYAITYKLLPSKFLESPQEVSDIKNFFHQLGWEYLGTSISNGLKRMPEVIEVRPHPTKKNTNIYRKKTVLSDI